MGHKDKKLAENARLRNCKNCLTVFIWRAIFNQLLTIHQYLFHVFLPKKFCEKSMTNKRKDIALAPVWIQKLMKKALIDGQN